MMATALGLIKIETPSTIGIPVFVRLFCFVLFKASLLLKEQVP